MLAPSLLDAENDLAAIANVFWSIGAFVQSCLCADVAQPDPALSWVEEVRQILADCRGVADRWLTDKPNIAPPLDVAFTSYASLVGGGVDQLAGSEDVADWTKFLTELKGAAQGNSDSARGVQALIAGHQGDFGEAYGRLQTAIQIAREALAEEQADILSVAVALQALNDRLSVYTGGFSASDLANGVSLYQTTVNISYDLLVDGSTAIPYVSIVTYLFTTGSSVYTTVSDDAEVARLAEQISALLRELDKDARELAMTQGLLQQLASMNDAYVEAKDSIPRINSYWDAEAAKIGIVLEALRTPNTPPSGITEIVSLPAAATVWQTIARLPIGMPMAVIADEKPVRVHLSVASVA